MGRIDASDLFHRHVSAETRGRGSRWVRASRYRRRKSSKQLSARISRSCVRARRRTTARWRCRPAPPAMLRVTSGEVAACHPRLEVLFRTPARQHKAHLALVIRAQQLEPLKPNSVLDLARPRSESLLELGEALARHRDRVDLDDAHTRGSYDARLGRWRVVSRAVVWGARIAGKQVHGLKLSQRPRPIDGASREIGELEVLAPRR